MIPLFLVRDRGKQVDGNQRERTGRDAHPIRSIQATGTTVAIAISSGGTSALSVISLRRNGMIPNQ